MDFLSFLEYPEYLPIFLIWASGYIFTYVVFGESRTWRNFDSTIKIIVGLLIGFAIEIGLILPAFSLIFGSSQVSLSLSTLERTWVFHWFFTAFIAGLKRVQDKKRFYGTIRLIFNGLGYAFLILILLFSMLIIEYWLFYPEYVIEASGSIINYLVINLVFSGLGFSVCLYFLLFGEGAMEEALLFGGKGYTFVSRREFSKSHSRFSRFKKSLRTRFFGFLRSRKRFVPPILVFIIVGVVIPFDSYFGVLTPRVTCFADVTKPSESIYYLSINARCMGYNKKPETEVKFLKSTSDIYQVICGKFDKLNVASIALAPRHLEKRVEILYSHGHLHDENMLRVFVNSSLRNNLTVTPFPSESDVKRLFIDYEKIMAPCFNITLDYYKDVFLDSVHVLPS